MSTAHIEDFDDDLVNDLKDELDKVAPTTCSIWKAIPRTWTPYTCFLGTFIP